MLTDFVIKVIVPLIGKKKGFAPRKSVADRFNGIRVEYVIRFKWRNTGHSDTIAAITGVDAVVNPLTRLTVRYEQ